VAVLGGGKCRLREATRQWGKLWSRRAGLWGGKLRQHIGWVGWLGLVFGGAGIWSVMQSNLDFGYLMRDCGQGRRGQGMAKAYQGLGAQGDGGTGVLPVKRGEGKRDLAGSIRGVMTAGEHMSDKRPVTEING